jgi:hypothetical protein
MIEVALRFVVEWMTDPVTGLNAQLAVVPRSGNIPQPDSAAIYNALDDDFVARGHVPDDKLVNGPIVMILAAVSAEQPVIAPLLPARQQVQSPEVPIQVTVVMKRTASAEHRTAAGLLLRAAMRTMTKTFVSHVTTFTRDDVVVRVGDTPAGLFTQLVDAGDDQLRGSIVFPLAVLDRWALGIT